MKVELNKKKEWEVLPNDSPNGLYLDGFIKEKLDNILEIQKKGWDATIIIDGKERSGKSKLGMTIGWYLSKKKLTINNFAKGLEEAKKKILELPNGSVLIVDESSLVFNSKETRSKASIELQKIMDVVGQKNMSFILILPSVFDLSKPMATRRSLFLLHVFVDENWKRGSVGYYGSQSKDRLYVEGKKNYNKYVVSPDNVCSFTDFEPPFYKEYLELKNKTLMEVLNPEPPKSKKELQYERRIERYKTVIVKAVNYAMRKGGLTKTEICSAIGMDRRVVTEMHAEILAKQAPVL